MKWQKPGFDEACPNLTDQRKQARLQWLQVPSQLKGENLNNVKRDAIRHFRNKEREYLLDKMNDLVTHTNNNNIRHLY
jgi:hypothetical protein